MEESKASDQRWGETVRFLSDICVFQLQKSNVRAGAQSTPRFQSGGPSQRPKIFLLEDWPQLQTSEAGKSPLKAAIGPEEWSKFTNYKTNIQEEGQLNSRHQSQSGPLRPDCESLPLIRRNIGISEGMVAPPPNYETPWSQRLSWSRLLFVAINNVKTGGCVYFVCNISFAQLNGSFHGVRWPQIKKLKKTDPS